MREEIPQQIKAFREEVAALDMRSSWMKMSLRSAVEVNAEWLEAREMPLQSGSLLSLVRHIRQTSRQHGEDVGHWVKGVLEWEAENAQYRCPLFYKKVTFERPNLISRTAGIASCREEWEFNPVLLREMRMRSGLDMEEFTDLEQVGEWWESQAPGRFRILDGQWLLRGTGAHQHLPDTLTNLATLPEVGGALSKVLRLEPLENASDEVLTPVLPADPTQVEVVSVKGSVCVQGPPGCGKTQTLVNLIAQQVMQGKKVAVLCKKPAALEVVAKKLDEVIPALPMVATSRGEATPQLADSWRTLDSESNVARKVESNFALTAEETAHRLLAIRKLMMEVRPSVGVSYLDLHGRVKPAGRMDVGGALPSITDLRSARNSVGRVLALPISSRAILPFLNTGTRQELNEQGLTELKASLVKGGELPQLKDMSFSKLLGSTASAGILAELTSRGRKRITSSFDQLELYVTEKRRLERRSKTIKDLEGQLSNWISLPSEAEVEGLREMWASSEGWWRKYRANRVFRKWFTIWPGEESITPSLRLVERFHQLRTKQSDQESLFRQKWGIEQTGTQESLLAVANSLSIEEWKDVCWLMENVEDLHEVHGLVRVLRKVSRQLFKSEPNTLGESEGLLRAWLLAKEQIQANWEDIKTCSRIGALPVLEKPFVDFDVLMQEVERSHMVILENAIFGDKGPTLLEDLIDLHRRALEREVIDIRLRLDHKVKEEFRNSMGAMTREERRSWAQLRREQDKKRNQKPLHFWFSPEHESVREQLVKVLLATPGEFATLPMDRGELFDVLIVDEATQLGAAEVIPALHLSKEVVCFGDSQQMSAASWMGTDALTFLANRLPNLALGVHYRSKDGYLMRFSNQRFYQGRLTLPSTVDAGVLRLERVAGEFLDGVNQREAEVAVGHVKDLLVANPTDSVGVGCMSRHQADLIADMLGELDDRCYIMNLENLQGSECDHMVITTQYVAQDGNLDLRLGPLSQEGGDRRMNVLVTRARCTMTVVTSLSPDEIRRSGNPGSDTLKDFLAYMQDPQPRESASGEGVDLVSWICANDGIGVRHSSPPVPNDGVSARNAIGA